MAFERATQVTSTVFGNVTKHSIRVGWIDPKNGFVDGYDLCAANDQARKDPGTVFIFEDGDHTLHYLNINEVNDLDAQSTLSASSTGGVTGDGHADACGGINERIKCGPPRIQIFGGGGVGALAHPIIAVSYTHLTLPTICSV